MDKALSGVRILDFTHVQSGPTCTQLLAYMGADVIKVERPGVGDITRGQLRDVPNADSLYFTMLNGNKRSITIDSKHPKGKEILDRLIADRHLQALDRHLTPEHQIGRRLHRGRRTAAERGPQAVTAVATDDGFRAGWNRIMFAWGRTAHSGEVCASHRAFVNR